jgi:hypothetical protein
MKSGKTKPVELAMTPNYDRSYHKRDKSRNENVPVRLIGILRNHCRIDNFPFWVLLLVAAFSLISRLLLLLK